MLTGQRSYLTARVSQPGRVLAIPVDEFRRVMSSKPDLADTIFSAFVARRELLRTGEGRAVRADHRLPLLARSDGVARVRGAVSCPTHVDRHRG